MEQRVHHLPFGANADAVHHVNQAVDKPVDDFLRWSRDRSFISIAGASADSRTATPLAERRRASTGGGACTDPDCHQ